MGINYGHTRRLQMNPCRDSNQIQLRSGYRLKRWIDKRQIHISLAWKKKDPLQFVNQHIKISLKFLEKTVVLTYCLITTKGHTFMGLTGVITHEGC